MFENPFLKQSKNSTGAEDDYEVPYPEADNLDEDGTMILDLGKASKFHDNVRMHSRKRVTCQAIDMDWLFDHNNAEVLIEMISNV